MCLSVMLGVEIITARQLTKPLWIDGKAQALSKRIGKHPRGDFFETIVKQKILSVLTLTNLVRRYQNQWQVGVLLEQFSQHTELCHARRAIYRPERQQEPLPFALLLKLGKRVRNKRF